MKKSFFKIYSNLALYKREEFKLFSFKLCFLNKKRQQHRVRISLHKSFQKTFCFETGVKRSVYTFFNISRWNLKKLLSATRINGLKKISW